MPASGGRTSNVGMTTGEFLMSCAGRVMNPAQSRKGIWSKCSKSLFYLNQLPVTIHSDF